MRQSFQQILTRYLLSVKCILGLTEGKYNPNDESFLKGAKTRARGDKGATLVIHLGRVERG